MDRLLKIGFRRVGNWEVVGVRLRCRLDDHARHPNCLYAFIADGEVLYVGKTTATLIGRMRAYAADGKARSTNTRSNVRIRRLLGDGRAVEIYVLPDEGLISCGPFNMNLAAALEDSIIRTIAPPWNGGPDRPDAAAEPGPVDPPADDGEPDAEPPQLPEVRVVLQPTYARTGFFNIGIAGSSRLGADGQVVELFLGDADEPILGSINRRANPNGSPRVMAAGVFATGWWRTCRRAATSSSRSAGRPPFGSSLHEARMSCLAPRTRDRWRQRRSRW